MFGVVDAREQRAHAELRPLALSKVVAEQDEVNRVVELTAGVTLQLHPVEVPGARLVFRVRSLDHAPLQALADVVQQGLGEDLYRVGLDDGRGQQHGRAGDHRIDHREPFLVRQLRKVTAVAVEDVEDERDQWQLPGGLLDAVLPPPARGQLERKVLLQFLAVSDGFTVKDQGLVLQRLGRRRELGEHQRVVLEISRENAHLRSVLVDLHPDAVVLGLDRNQTKPLDHGLGVGEALRELASNRASDGDLECVDRAFATRPEGLRDQAEVGYPVVGALQYRSQGLVAFLRKRQRVEDGGITNAKPQSTERDPHQVLGRYGVDLLQQSGKQRALLLDRSGAAG